MCISKDKTIIQHKYYINDSAHSNIYFLMKFVSVIFYIFFLIPNKYASVKYIKTGRGIFLKIINWIKIKMTKIYRMRGKQRFKRPRLERKKKKRSQINDLNFHLEIFAEEKQINSKFSKQKEGKKDQRRNQKSQKNDSSQ